MREHKHAYCSGQGYSASISVGVQSHLVCLLRARAYACTFHACAPPRVLHFSAFIFLLYCCILYIMSLVIHNCQFLDCCLYHHCIYSLGFLSFSIP